MRRGSLFDTTSLFRDFDNMHRKMNRILDENSSTRMPNEVIIEYETQEGDDEIGSGGSTIYGYTTTIGPDDGKQHVREFGDVEFNDDATIIEQNLDNPFISQKRDMPSDITTTDEEVKVVLKMPGIQEEDIKIDIYHRKVEIKTRHISPIKYFKVVELPKEADTKTTRFIYDNDTLEITFDKKSDIKTKEKDFSVHLRNIFSNISRMISEFKSKIL